MVAGRQLAEGFSSGIRTFQDGVSPYPMGNLRSSALDLARFMIMYTSDGRVFGNEVLAPGTVAFALSPQASGGVFWGPWKTKSGRVVWSHGGVMAGVCARLDIDPVRTALNTYPGFAEQARRRLPCSGALTVVGA